MTEKARRRYREFSDPMDDRDFDKLFMRGNRLALHREFY
jgi:hypothetical protein